MNTPELEKKAKRIDTFMYVSAALIFPIIVALFLVLA